MPLIVMEYNGASLDGDRTKKIVAPPDSSFRLGSKVDCFGYKWLVTRINYNQEVKLSGQMQLCNYTLKWQDKSGAITEEECVVDTFNNLKNGEDKGNVVTTNDTRRSVLIQFNSDTSKITQGKRMFIDLEGVGDPKVYKLTVVDRVSYIYGGYGFIRFTFTECEKRDTDRADIMIADYVDPTTSPSTSIGLCSISYNGEPLIKSGGTPKAFRAVFTDSDGGNIATIVPTWELLLPDDLSNKIAISSQVGQEINIQALSDADIGQMFTLKLSANDSILGYFEYLLDVSVGELW